MFLYLSVLLSVWAFEVNLNSTQVGVEENPESILLVSIILYQEEREQSASVSSSDSKSTISYSSQLSLHSLSLFQVRPRKSRNQKESVVGRECAYSSDFKNYPGELTFSSHFLSSLNSDNALLSWTRACMCICHFCETL
jgi:hypothetical protein